MCQQGNLVEAMLSTAGAYDYVGNIATSQSLRTLLVSGYSFDIVSNGVGAATSSNSSLKHMATPAP